jgi:hypothetical protein
VSRQIHYYGENHLHYLTANIYRRARIFDSDRFKLKFTQALADLRAELGFWIIGYVLMPEHCHLLIWHGRSRQSFANLGANYAEVIGADRQLHTTHPAAQRCSAVVPKNADPVRAAPDGASSRSPPGVAAGRIRHEHLEREEAAGKAQLHARQSCEARAGKPAWRLAVVKLAVLLPGRHFDSSHGSNALNSPAVATTCSSMSSPPAITSTMAAAKCPWSSMLPLRLRGLYPMKIALTPMPF